MSDQIDYRYLDQQPIIELWFGNDQTSLYVQEGLLQKIPFFAGAIRFKETAHNETGGVPRTQMIDLHDCNSKIVADVIHYTIIDGVPSIHDVELLEYPYDACNHKDVKLYAQAWIIADRFGLEKIANTLIDRPVQHAESWGFNPSLFTLLAKAGHKKSRFRTFIVQTIAHKIASSRKAHENFFRIKVPSYTEGEQHTLSVSCKQYKILLAKLPSSELARILRLSHRVHTCLLEDVFERPCALHKHEVTDTCPETGH